MEQAERDRLIARYEAGPARLRAAVAAVPPEALRWRPAAGEWSAHEVVVHCGDAETNGAMRLRYLAAAKEPMIVGYDQAGWASELDYHAHPIEAALAAVEAVRANTVPLLRRLPEEAWRREGRHTELGRFTTVRWLELYADHLEIHARQIEANVAAWRAQKG